MDYKAKYNEALERARELSKTTTGANYEYIFPELEESEDERVKRILHDISYKMSFHLHDIFTEEEFQCYDAWSNAWLKKQEEKQKLDGSFVNVDDVREDFVNEVYRVLDADPTNDRANQIIDAFDNLPTISIQKPADKSEPKFHEGDWVVFNNQPEKGSIYQVEKIKNFQYTLRHILGGSFPLSFSHENKIRPWTIQDAKDGDVLFYDDGWTCMFKHIHGIWYSSHCFITADGEFHTGYERHAVDAKMNGNVHPATKEQRDLLFQKMKEAGYSWNADKKELKKL